ncbi:hypothetical protein EYF80_053983 [Liparis tanakae]|uniref:Uncharacterized protein n=1 Tax=Liparis tanakae TaxID=230148 RepID=A0A4Z2F518_9TELE|nr:hypothetical protein EYF80_053983 [Liparis tanakae]
MAARRLARSRERERRSTEAKRNSDGSQESDSRRREEMLKAAVSVCPKPVGPSGPPPSPSRLFARLAGCIVQSGTATCHIHSTAAGPRASRPTPACPGGGRDNGRRGATSARGRDRISGHLDFCAPLQEGSHPVPHDAAVEASMGAVQGGDELWRQYRLPAMRRQRNLRFTKLLYRERLTTRLMYAVS